MDNNVIGTKELLRKMKETWSPYQSGQLIRFKDRYVAMPMTLDMEMYRGQTKDYGHLKASIFRNNDAVRQCIDEAKLREFKGVAKSISIISDELTGQFDPVAIAQHYGMATDYLDITNSFAVALFFAICKFDEDCGGYRPLKTSEIKDNPYGVIYHTVSLVMSIYGDDYMPLGFSSLNRPSAQRGFMIRDKNGDFLDGIFAKWRFKHSRYLSDNVFRFFHSGNDIMPPDDSPTLIKLIEDIKASDTVYRPYYLDACREHKLDGTDEELISMLGDVSVTEQMPSWDLDMLAAIDMELRENNYLIRNNVPIYARLCYCGD